MRIKKKELRKREAQLPINFPAPTIEQPFVYERERDRVENLCKRLAHNEVEVRDAVLAELPRYLREVSAQSAKRRGQSGDAVSANDAEHSHKVLEMILLKLCLGLYYCMWHSDKPLVQHECAFRISQLMFAPSTREAQLLFVKCMFRILVKQWSKIDHYRLDKYMALVRKLVFQMICFLSQIEHNDDVHPVRLKAEGAFISAAEDPLRVGTAKKPGKGNSATKAAAAAASSKAALEEAMKEIAVIFQEEVLESTTSVGLTMHLCDLFFDELCRANVSPPLFVALARSIPCFAMSRGNFVEKRVLDNFFAPLTGGVLEARWGEDRREDVQEVFRRMADVCREYAVAPSTVRSARVMFSEAQLLLQTNVTSSSDPSLFVSLQKRDKRRQIAREVDELDSRRVAVAQELDGARSAKRAEKRAALKRYHAASETGGEVDPRARDVGRQAEAKAAKKARRIGTKRKKIVRLSKKDIVAAAK